MLPEAVNYPERGRDLPGSERGGGKGGGTTTLLAVRSKGFSWGTSGVLMTVAG